MKSDQDGDIVMHDLIREMAEQIVRDEESMRHPERRSRLKDPDEIYDVLKSNMETDKIEGIILDVSRKKYVQVEADIFVKMKNLRFLKFFHSSFWLPHGRTYVDLLSDLDSFPNKLRYLHWDRYPSETLPSGSYLENLVELHMEGNNFKRLWDGKQDLGNLKKINLSFSKQLIELPDLSMAHKLESVDLKCCESLRNLHPSILSLPSIIEMEVSGCSKLESIESETHLESLSHLRASGCCLKKLCLSSNKLSRLFLLGTEVEILHFPIDRCTKLTEIAIEGSMVGSVSIDELCCLTNLELFCVTNLKQVIDIKQLHSLFDSWRNLRVLCLDGSYLSEIPDNIKALTKLECLSLNGSAVETLPACINHLSSLTRIELSRCKRLKSILGLPPFLQQLFADECTLLETVSSDSLVRKRCIFNFCNCEKLDERSLRYIQELIHSSMTSDSGCFNSNEDDKGITCYPGSRVPEWMEYKPIRESFNETELTCFLEQSQDLLVYCIVLPKGLEVCCYFRQYYESDLSFLELNRDHVLLWPETKHPPFAVSAFFMRYWDEEEKAYCRSRAKVIGAHRI